MYLRWILVTAFLCQSVSGSGLLTDVQFRSGRTRPRQVVFVRSGKPALIDGSLNDDCWKAAARLGPLLATPTSEAANATVVRVACDPKTLYLAFECATKPGAKLRQRTPATVRDGNVWGDDCLDVFLSPNEGRTVLQVLANSLGALYDARNGDTTWNPAVRVAAKPGAKGYAAEIAIPRSALELPHSRRAPDLLFSVGRNDRTLGELSALTLPYGDPASFTRIVLGTREVYEAEMRKQLAPEAVSLCLYADREAYPSTQRQAWCRLRVATTAEIRGQARADIQIAGANNKALAQATFPALADKVIDFGLDLTGLPNAAMTLRARLTRADGQVLAEASRPLTKVARPAPRLSRVPLRIPAAPGGAREWPVTVGVPLPQGALWQVQSARLVDDKGRAVPWQAEVAARWSRGGSVKWMLAHFTANLGPRRGVYYLELGQPEAPPKPKLSLDLQETDEAFTVTTGPARFRLLRRKFNGMDQAWLDRNRDGQFDRGEAVFVKTPERGAYMVDHTGKSYWSTRDAKVESVVERSGPQVVTLKFEGWHVAEGGAKLGKFIVRVSAFAGQPFVRIMHTFVITADSNKTRYRDIGLRFAPRLTHFYIGSASSHTGVVRRESDRASLVQVDDRRYDFLTAGRFVRGGTRAEGWVTAANDRAGMSLLVKDFWQQYPKEFEVGPNELTLHLWPAHNPPRRHTGDRLTIHNAGHLWFAHEGRELDFRVPDEYFDPKKGLLPEITVENAKPGVPSPKVINAIGLAKTHEMMLVLHGPSWEQAGVRELNEAFQFGPAAIVDPQWVCESGVFGAMWPRDEKRFPQAESAIEMVSDKIFRQQKIDRDYGMFNFGDSHHNWYWQERRWSLHRIWRNTHHGWGRWPWLLFARSGSKRFLDWAARNARHVMDVDHCHYTTPEFVGLPWPRGKMVGGICDYKGLAHWASGARLGYNSAADPFLWHYYMTGERRGYDVALEHGQALLSQPRPRAHREGAGRATSAVALYQATWDNDYLEFVERHLDALLGTQRDDGTFPQWENFAPYLQRYIEQTGARRGRDAMVRWADAELAHPFERRGYHARLNILAHAYLFIRDPKYLALGNHRLSLFTDHLYTGPDERFHGTLIPFNNSVNESYFLQEVPYYLQALAESRQAVPAKGPTRSALRTFNRMELDGQSLHVLRVFLREDADAERVLRVTGRGSAKHYRVRLLDPAGRVLADQQGGPKVGTRDFEFSVRLPRDGRQEYELRIYGDSNFVTRVPITQGEPALREVYTLGERGMGVSCGSRFYFSPPAGCEEFRIYANGRPWPNELVLYDPSGQVVSRDVWIRINEPYWSAKYVGGRPSPGQAGLWSFALFVSSSESISRFEALPKHEGSHFYFAAAVDKHFEPVPQRR